MAQLLTPIKIGTIQLKNRVVLAPLTRFRADKDHVHGPLAVEYYSQRASVPGTLLITEGTFISPEAGGMDHVPGIWNAAQVQAWKAVTDAVHAKGSYIFVQLWALGRAANASVLAKEGLDVVSASDIPIDSQSAVPKPLDEDGIQGYIRAYVAAAKNAVEAGFDGVEIHGANGYLPDQFLQDVSNTRTDRWGGSVENRARFGTEIAKAVAAAIGPEKVGYRISPWSPFQAMKMDDPVPQFTELAKNLNEIGLAYLHVVNSRIAGNKTVDSRAEQADFLLDIWTSGAVILAGGFTLEAAEETLAEYKDYRVLVAFGRHFIANPDLPFRFQKGLELNAYDRSTFYTPQDPVGYTDQPFSSEFLEARI